MREQVRRRLAYEVLRRKQRGDSERAISRALGIHRHTVRGLLAELETRRAEGDSALERELRPPTPRGSKLDRYAKQIEAWLAEYEDLTAVRLHEKLKRRLRRRLHDRARVPQSTARAANAQAGLRGRRDPTGAAGAVRLVAVHAARLRAQSPAVGVLVELVARPRLRSLG